MNLKFVLAFIVYWLLCGLFYNFGGVYLAGATTTAVTPDLNITGNITSNTTAIEGESNFFSGLSNTINRILSTIGFIFFGVGLPSDTPGWFATIFIFIQVAITTLAVFVALDGVWHG